MLQKINSNGPKRLPGAKDLAAAAVTGRTVVPVEAADLPVTTVDLAIAAGAWISQWREVTWNNVDFLGLL